MQDLKHTREPTKTQKKYRGPLVVIDVLPNDTYRVSHVEEKRKGRFHTTTAHVLNHGVFMKMIIQIT